MTQHINPAFQEALRQLGRPTTLADLSRRGVTRLRSLKSTEVGILIERAVNRTLMERTIGPLDEQEMLEVLHEAENHFTRQLRDFEELADAKASIASHRHGMAAELARLRSARSGRLERAEPELAARTADLRRRLSAEIAMCLGPLLSDGRIEGAAVGVAERLRALVETHVEAALEEQRRRFEVEIDIQMRRVAKLMKFLEQTEELLARVSASKGLDHGIASFYRNVQGLAPGDVSYETKRRMLERIFEENTTGGAGDESSPPNPGRAPGS
jgi:hypothetical protein